MAESILVTGKRISSMELVTNVTGIEKIPTGQPDDLAITPNQIADHTITRGDLASHGDLSQVEVDLTTQIATLAGDVAAEDNSIRGLIAAEEAARIAADDALQSALDAESLARTDADTGLQSALDAEVAARIAADDLKVDLATTVQTFITPEAGVDPVTGVADGAYFNVRSEDDETAAIEYQNVGGNAVATGKSYSDVTVVMVDSIADLLALPEGKRKEGLRYLVKGYHAGSDVGGGEFYWDANSIESDNGGTVFEVVGVEIGRFVRVFEGAAHVTWFGAVGDGVTENQEIPIQKAVDAIRDVYIPSGTYMLNNWINLRKSGTTLFGEKSSVLKHSPSFYKTFWGALGINDENVRDITIKGMTLDGSRKDLPNYDPITDLNTESGSTPLIRIQGTGSSKYSANIHITDVSFIHSALDSIYIRAPYIKDINVSGCYSYDCGRSHLVVTEGEGIIFDRNICVDAKNSMFDIETNTADVAVRNVTLSNNILLSQSSTAAGIGLTGRGTHENIIISNNMIHAQGHILQFGQCSNLIFSGNVCSGVNNREGRGVIETLAEAKDVVFTGNSITTRNALGEGGTGSGMWIRSPQSITFSNNVFDFELSGIQVDQGGFGVRIVGNKISSQGTALSVASAVGAFISDNEIKSSGFNTSAITLSSPDLIFSGNSVHAGGSEIFLYSSSGTYVNNTFSEASTIRVRYAAGGTSSIIGNRMSLQKFESVDVSNLILKDNVMSFENKALGDMVDIQSGTLYANVTGNLIYAEESTSTTSNGVYMRAPRFTFTGNSVVDRKSTQTVGAALRTGSEALFGIIQGNTFGTSVGPTLNNATDFKPFIPDKTRTENLNIFNHLIS